MKKIIGLILAALLALSALSAYATEYTDKATVKQVQQALNDAGYNCDTPDGAAGKKTKAAITDYQTDRGLSVTGVINDELLIALELKDAEAAGALSAEAGDELTFQGIPWGSTPEEVKALLVEKSLIDAETSISSERPPLMFSYYPKNLEKMTSSQDIIDFAGLAHNYDFNYGTHYSIALLKSIGGVEPESTELSFLYSVENGEITPKYQFMYVGMYMGKDEGEFDKLSEGLASKYGNFTNKAASGNTVHVWQGSNQTAIVLARATNDDIYLVYAKKDSYDLLQEMKAIDEANKTPVEDAGL